MLAGGIVVGAVVVALVVVAPWESDPGGAPVGSSEVSGYSTRGSLADDSAVVEAAADAWRSGDSYMVTTRPDAELQLLWAGEVDAQAIDGLVTDEDTPDEVGIVVLVSDWEVATFAVTRDGDDITDVDGLGVKTRSTYPTAVLSLAGNLALTAEAMPDTFEAVDRDGATSTVTADDGLVASTSADSAFALRLPSIYSGTGDPTPGVYVGGRVLAVVAADADRIWQLLTDPDRAASVRDGLRDAVGPRSKHEGGRLEGPEIEIVGELTSPDGKPVLVLDAGGNFAAWTRAVVAVEVTLGPDPSHTVVSLGSTPDEGAWTGSAWVTSEDAAPYLVVAGGNGTERIEVFAGTESAQVVGAGIVAPVVTGTDNALPDVVIAGFTADGTAVAPMPLP